MAIGHWLVETGPHCPALARANGATALGFSSLGLVLAWRPPAIAWAHALATLVVGVVLANGAAELALSDDPAKTDAFVLMMVGAAVLILSRRWFWLMSGAVAGTWLVLMAAHVSSASETGVGPASPEWAHSVFTIVIGSALALVVHETRYRLHFRMQDLLDSLRRQRVRLRGALEQARGSAARMAQVLNGTLDGIITFNGDGIIEAFNPAACRMFGYASEEVVGGHVEMLLTQPIQTIVVDPDDEEHAEAHPPTACRSQAVRTPGRMHEIEGVRHDGTGFPLEISVSEVEIEGQRVFTAVVRDITERRKAEERALRQTQEREASEARAQLARDVHDGMLQLFTGAVFQLAEIEAAAARNPSEAAARAGSLRKIIAEEQAHLRFFVDTFKQGGGQPKAGAQDLKARLESLAALTGAVWNISVDLAIQVDNEVSERMVHEVYRLVQEALVNAARHGKAQSVRVSVLQVGPYLCLVISDNGHGFPFSGIFDDSELRRRNLGPAMLQDRVRVNNGRLSLESREGGSTLKIVLPDLAETAVP